MLKLPWRKKKKEPIRKPHLMEGQDDYIFRRSRTLTGTSSARVVAGAEARGRLKTDRVKLQELKAHRSVLRKVLTGVLVLCGLFSFLLINFVATPDIRFAQKGAHTPDGSIYQKVIYDYFNDRPLERFGFLLNPETLQAQLTRSKVEISAVTVQRDWYGGNVRFNLQFRQPLLMWNTADKRFYVDSQGVAFGYNHFAEPAVVVTDQSGISPDQTGAVASSRFIRFLGRTVGAVNAYGKGRVTSVSIPASTREVDVKLEGRDYPIKMHSDRDPLQQAEDIASALAYFDKRGIKPEYIDVRVAHKAFYKG